MSAALNQEIENEIEDDGEITELKLDDIDDGDEIVEDVEVIDDEKSDDPIEEKDEEELPDEAKEMIRPNMKNKTQKRIVNLVRDNKELKERLARIEASEKQRVQKETKLESDTRMQELMERHKEAFEDGDYDAATKINFEIMQAAQNNQLNPNQQSNVNPDKYFSQNNSWYNNSNSDPGLKKTRYAKSLSAEIELDQRYSSWTIEQKLDEVSRQTNAAFKTNAFRDQSPTEGVTRSQVNKNSVSVTKSDISMVKQMYGDLPQNELIKIARELKKNIKK
jgi:hypothetical protein